MNINYINEKYKLHQDYFKQPERIRFKRYIEKLENSEEKEFEPKKRHEKHETIESKHLTKTKKISKPNNKSSNSKQEAKLISQSMGDKQTGKIYY